MSLVALSNEDFLGAFAFFVEEGETVDAQTISSTIKPDVDPVSNWPSLGDVQNFGFGKEEIDDPYFKVNPGGGMTKHQRKWVVADFLDFQTRQMNELVYRLTMGFTDKIESGEAQSPHVPGTDRVIRGWLRMQARALAGTDRFLLDWWCELRIATDPKFEAKTTMPALRAYKLAPVAANSGVVNA
jgi:hypothetical protein